jgi:hypothetical protein
MKKLEVHAKLHVVNQKPKTSNRSITPAKIPKARISEGYQPLGMHKESPNIVSLKAIPQQHQLDPKPIPTITSIINKSPSMLQMKSTANIGSETQILIPILSRHSMTESLNAITSIVGTNKTKTLEQMKEISSRPSILSRLKSDTLEEQPEVEQKSKAISRSNSQSLLKHPQALLTKQKPVKIMIQRSRIISIAAANLNSKLQLIFRKKIYDGFTNIKHQFIIDHWQRSKLKRIRRLRLIKRVFNGLKNLRTHIKKATNQNYTFSRPVSPLSTLIIESKPSIKSRVSNRSITPKKSSKTTIIPSANSIALEEPKSSTFKLPTPTPKGIIEPTTPQRKEKPNPKTEKKVLSIEELKSLAKEHFRIKACK